MADEAKPAENAVWKCTVYDGDEVAALVVRDGEYVVFKAQSDKDGVSWLKREQAIEFATAMLACAIKLRERSVPVREDLPPDEEPTP